MAVSIEKILCAGLNKEGLHQVEEMMETLGEGPEGFYESRLD